MAQAVVVKLVDTIDLGSIAERHGGSSPPDRTSSFYNKFLWKLVRVNPHQLFLFSDFLQLDKLVYSPSLRVSNIGVNKRDEEQIGIKKKDVPKEYLLSTSYCFVFVCLKACIT